jgi:hypothetical protein
MRRWPDVRGSERPRRIQHLDGAVAANPLSDHDRRHRRERLEQFANARLVSRAARTLRKDQFGPDTSYGTVDFSGCTSSGLTYNWGRVGSETFFDQIHQYSFGTLSATSFNVGY